MKTSIIRHRVADFLKRHAPFDSLSQHDLLELAGSGRVKFHESQEYVFRQDDVKGQFVWIVQQGRVELLEESASGEQLRDVAGEGDVLGLEQFIGDGSCLFSARTATDVILYGVAVPLVESLIPRYPLVKRFLSAQFSISGILGFGRTSWLDAEAPSADFLRGRLVILPVQSSSSDVAAQLAVSRNEAVALVDGGNRPVGIVTPIDLCRPRSEPLPPPPTIALPLTTRMGIREMLRARTEELAITADGTSGSSIEAIVTASELSLFCGHNPLRLMNAIRNASSLVEIVPLLQRARRLMLDGLAQPLDIDDCCLAGTEVVRALAEACIRLGHSDVLAAGIDPPGVPYCWIMFGTSARGELISPRQPTIATIYDDFGGNFNSRDSVYFAAQAGKVATWFHDCGLAAPDMFWPEGTQPSMPLSEWKRFYRETIRNPAGHDLYARRKFFDLRSLSGDHSILRKLADAILLELHEHETAIPLLANDTLAHLPPLTFFQGLVLELDGAQRDRLDIVKYAVSPIADAARVFAIANRRLAPANTLDRLSGALLDFPEDAATLREAADAFRIGLYYQALAGGSRIDPSQLGKYDQRLLKTAFASIQRLLEFTARTFVPAA